MRFAIIAGLALILSGCGVEGGLPLRTTIKAEFDPYEMEFATKPGTGKIVGQAFIRRSDGGVDSASLKRVLLIPKSRYTDEIVGQYAGNYNKSIEVSNFDQRLGSFVRFLVADAGGAFMFLNIPPGQYYLITGVDQRVSALIAGYNTVPKSLLAQVTVKDRGTVTAIFN